MNWNLNWTAIITALIGVASGWYASSKNDHTSREEIYAKHVPDLWTRLDNQSKQLDKVIAERDELRDRVKDLQVKIDQLTKLVNELKMTYKENNDVK